MESFKFSSMVFLAMALATTMQFYSMAAPTTHVVGNTLGWAIPPNGPLAYILWASSENFTVGDTLEFNFFTGYDNVAEVSPAAYALCDITNPIFVNSTGPAIVKLTTAGQHYYISTIVPHCELGQMLAINVVAASNSTSVPLLRR